MRHNRAVKSRVGLFNRPKPRRLKRGAVSLDDSLIAAAARPGAHQAAQPLVRGLALPLCAPTIVAPPVGGKPFVDRLDPKDVSAANMADMALTAVLMGFAQVRPEGAKKVVMTRYPSEDVIVRLYHETQNGLIFPTWVLARTHRQAQMMHIDPTVSEETSTEAEGRKTVGVMFCQYLAKALGPTMKLLNGKPVQLRLASLVRCVTGRNLAHLPLGDKDREATWEQLLAAVCSRRPVYASTSQTNPQHQKRRRFAANAPVVVLEAFELRGERYVCVFDPTGAADGSAPAPKDMLLNDFLSELDGLYAVA